MRGSCNPGWHRPGQFVTKLGGFPPLKQRTSFIILKRLFGPNPSGGGSLQRRTVGACDQVPAFRHRVSVSISASTSELGWEAFQPGGYPVVAFEAVSTVSWKGPQAGQGPSRPPGLLVDRGCQHQALRTFCTSWHYRATCSCQVSCPFWLHLSLCLSLHSLSSGP